MFDVVDVDLPILLSMHFMKNLGMILHHRKDQDDFCEVGDLQIKLHTKRGHNWLTLSKEGARHDVMNRVMATQTVFEPGKELANLRQLHSNIAHPNRDRMIAMLKASGQWSPQLNQLLDTLYLQCPNRSCRTKGQLQKPGNISYKIIKEMGDLVAIDLKIRPGKRDILYMYCRAAVR